MLADTINRFIENRLSSVYTAIPGVVKKINGNIADIQPAVSQSGAVLPVLPDVPIVFPASKSSGFVFEVAKGDSVLLIFANSSIDEWLGGNGSEAETDDPRRFDITDAVAIPGLFSLGSVPTLGSADGCVMSHDDTTITIKKSGDVVIGGATATALVKESFIDVVATHTHPYLNATTPSTTSPPLPLITSLGNVTTKTSAV